MKEFVKKLIEKMKEDILYPSYVREEEVDDFIYQTEDIALKLAEEYEKKKILCEITLNGCDDDTCFEFKMTEQEYEFIKKVSEKANETSAYTCMPRMYVEKLGLFQKEGKKNWKF